MRFEGAAFQGTEPWETLRSRAGLKKMADVMVEHSVEVSALGAKRRSAQGGSMDKLKDVLGVDDSGLVKALGDGNMVWQEVEERIVDGGREASIRRAQKSKKAQQILGISRTTIALMVRPPPPAPSLTLAPALAPLCCPCICGQLSWFPPLWL